MSRIFFVYVWVFKCLLCLIYSPVRASSLPSCHRAQVRIGISNGKPYDVIPRHRRWRRESSVENISSPFNLYEIISTF